MNYIGILTREAEQKLDDLLPERFSIIFDGWISSLVHYFFFCVALYNLVMTGDQ